MALYHQLKFPSAFIEYRSVSEWKGVVVINNFDSPRQLPRHKYAPEKGMVYLTLFGLMANFTSLSYFAYCIIFFSSLSTTWNTVNLLCT